MNFMVEKRGGFGNISAVLDGKDREITCCFCLLLTFRHGDRFGLFKNNARGRANAEGIYILQQFCYLSDHFAFRYSNFSRPVKVPFAGQTRDDVQFLF